MGSLWPELGVAAGLLCPSFHETWRLGPENGPNRLCVNQCLIRNLKLEGIEQWKESMNRSEKVQLVIVIVFLVVLCILV